MDPRQAAMLQALLAKSQPQQMMGGGVNHLSPQQIQQIMQQPYSGGTNNPSILQSMPTDQLMRGLSGGVMPGGLAPPLQVP